MTKKRAAKRSMGTRCFFGENRVGPGYTIEATSRVGAGPRRVLMCHRIGVSGRGCGLRRILNERRHPPHKREVASETGALGNIFVFQPDIEKRGKRVRGLPGRCLERVWEEMGKHTRAEKMREECTLGFQCCMSLGRDGLGG